MEMNGAIMLQGFAVDRRWFHSGGLARIDTAEKKEGEVPAKSNISLFLQLNLVTPGGKLQVVSLQELYDNGKPDNVGTIKLYISLIKQLGTYTTPEMESLLLHTYTKQMEEKNDPSN